MPEPILPCLEGLMRECFQCGPEPDAALCNAVATACEARQAGRVDVGVRDVGDGS